MTDEKDEMNPRAFDEIAEVTALLGHGGLHRLRAELFDTAAPADSDPGTEPKTAGEVEAVATPISPILVVLADRVSRTGPRDAAEAQRLIAGPARSLLTASWRVECPTDELLLAARQGEGEAGQALRELLAACHTNTCSRCRRRAGTAVPETSMSALLAPLDDVDAVVHSWHELDFGGPRLLEEVGAVRGLHGDADGERAAATERVILDDDLYQQLHNRPREDRDRPTKLDVTLNPSGTVVSVRLITAADIGDAIVGVAVVAHTTFGPVRVPVTLDRSGAVSQGHVELAQPVASLLPPIGLEITRRVR